MRRVFEGIGDTVSKNPAKGSIILSRLTEKRRPFHSVLFEAYFSWPVRTGEPSPRLEDPNFCDIRFDKTHDIEVLLSQASTIDRAFSSWASAAGLLTPFAVEYRYPGASTEPEPDEFTEAYESASQLFAFVPERLPDIVKPK